MLGEKAKTELIVFQSRVVTTLLGLLHNVHRYADTSGMTRVWLSCIDKNKVFSQAHWIGSYFKYSAVEFYLVVLGIA